MEVLGDLKESRYRSIESDTGHGDADEEPTEEDCTAQRSRRRCDGYHESDEPFRPPFVILGLLDFGKDCETSEETSPSRPPDFDRLRQDRRRNGSRR